MTSEDIKKIREMIEFLVKQKISESLKKLSQDEKKVYDLTEQKNQAGIVQSTGISAGKVSNIWVDLESKGLIVKKGKKYYKVV